MALRHDPSFDDAFDDLFAVAERIARRIAGPAESEDIAHRFDTAITTHVEQVTFVDPLNGWAWNAGGYQTTDGRNRVPVA
jgi:hypothetical protein